MAQRFDFSFASGKTACSSERAVSAHADATTCARVCLKRQMALAGRQRTRRTAGRDMTPVGVTREAL